MMHGDAWYIPRDYYDGWFNVPVEIDFVEVQTNKPEAFSFHARPDIAQWCREHIGVGGGPGHEWRCSIVRHRHWQDLHASYKFKHRDHALLFKLTWVGT